MAQKFDARQMISRDVLSQLLGINGTELDDLLRAINKEFNAPLRISATFPTADSKLNFQASEVEATDLAGKSVGPIATSVPSFAATTIDFQTATVTGGTVSITFPNSTVGFYRRVGFSLRKDSTLEAVFSAESGTIGGLAAPGTLFIEGAIPIGWIDLEATAASPGRFKTAGSSTNIIENKVGSSQRIHRIESLTYNRQEIQFSVANDTATGSNASLSSFTSGIVRLTNGSLTSVSGIPAGSSGQSLIVENKTGNQITINNEETTPTAANRIQTGTGANASMPNNASFVFIYDSTSSRWQLTGSIAASTTDVLKQHKNYIMNGAMEIAQRGTSFVAAASSSYTVDRFQYVKSGTMVHTISQDTDVPTLAQAGYVFNNSLRFNLTTADTSIAAGDNAIFGQKIEGYNYASIAQKAFVLSFWVKATATGTYCVSFQNSVADRSYVAEYTVNSTATWEYKTISVTAPPSAGTWDYTNGIGLMVNFVLAAGSTFQTTAGTWQTGNFHATSNQVNGVNTGATDFRVTGVQLQEGSTATSFRLYNDNFADELRACERFYEKSYILSAVPGSNTAAERVSITVIGRSGSGVGSAVQFRTVKRAAPTMSLWNNTGTSNTVTWIDSGAGGSTDAASTISNIGTKGFQVVYTTATNGTVYVGLFHFAATADL